VAAIRAGDAAERCGCCEHPPLLTAGCLCRSDRPSRAQRFPVFETRRGGSTTYHGPGQRVAYVMLDLSAGVRDVRRYVHQLEDWVIATLASFNVKRERRAGRVGVWVVRPDRPPGPDGAPR
jgi:lipoyl(octanoyl) transferase